MATALFGGPTAESMKESGKRCVIIIFITERERSEWDSSVCRMSSTNFVWYFNTWRARGRAREHTRGRAVVYIKESGMTAIEKERVLFTGPRAEIDTKANGKMITCGDTVFIYGEKTRGDTKESGKKGNEWLHLAMRILHSNIIGPIGRGGAKEGSHILKETCMMDIGWEISEKAMADASGKMEECMKENGRTIWGGDEAKWLGRVELSMKESGKAANLMERVFIHGLMEENMWEN